jgi:hypothetical protein
MCSEWWALVLAAVGGMFVNSLALILWAVLWELP